MLISEMHVYCGSGDFVLIPPSSVPAGDGCRFCHITSGI